MYFGSMPRQNKDLRPKLDLEAEALAALGRGAHDAARPRAKRGNETSGHSAECRGLAGHIFCKTWKTCQTLGLEALL